MPKQWLDPQPVELPPEWLNHFKDDHPLLPELLARRGIQTVLQAQQFLDPEYYTPAPPLDLPDMAQGVERVAAAIQHGERICIWGDFDVDGQTSTALLVSALRQLDAQVTYYIPDRQHEGHGVHVGRLASLIDDGVQLVITCDTGISAHTAVDYANARGVDVVVTDHHQLPPELPAACANINPQRLPEGHPSRTLPGVGCAYKFVQALYDGRETAQFLDLVALGIVADVAVLTGDARYLLQRGLHILRQTQRPGLNAMIELAELSKDRLTELDIGFSLGPRLNAVGRLDDANFAVELLTTADEGRARILANRLEGLNTRRKMMSEQVFKAAQGQVKADPNLLNYAVVVLAHDSWPGGIIGIVANRLVELYHRPVILFTIDDGIARGSARSIAALDITHAIAQHADMLNTYGGHTMAAGLSLPADRVPDFRRAISRTAQNMLTTLDTTPTLQIDVLLSLEQVNPDLLDTLDRLSPFGPGNPPVIFATPKLTLQDIRTIGKSGEHARLTVMDEAETTRDVLWWRADAAQLPPGRFDMAYRVSANTFQGRREIQLELLDFRPIDEEPLTFSQRRQVEFIDFRQVDDPERQLQEVCAAEPDALIYAEGRTEVEGHKRHQLKNCPTLIIWTAPPGMDELQAILAAVNPSRVYLFGVNPGTDSVQVFLRHFGGLVKHVLSHHGGDTTLAKLAGAAAQREATILAGLDWLITRRHISVIYDDDGETLHLKSGEENTTPSNMAQSTAKIAALLHETAAFRAYFRTADTRTFL